VLFLRVHGASAREESHPLHGLLRAALGLCAALAQPSVNIEREPMEESRDETLAGFGSGRTRVLPYGSSGPAAAIEQGAHLRGAEPQLTRFSLGEPPLLRHAWEVACLLAQLCASPLLAPAARTALAALREHCDPHVVAVALRFYKAEG
jgi:hypothetical protein